MNNSVSLLYRPGFKKAGPENIKGLLQEMLQEDLNVDKILDSLFRRGKCKKKEALLDTLMDWETDTENIEYRLDIMEEVFKKPGILKRILEVIAHTEAFAGDRRVVVSYHRANSFRQIKSGAEHLLLYLETLEMLARALGSKGQYESEGLQNLAQYAIGYVTSEDYKQLQAILQMIQAGGSSLFNLKLSVRRSLNFQLRTATLVEINHETLYQPGIAESNSVLDGLFRRNRGKPNESFITEPKFIGQRCVGEAAEKSLYHLGGYISGISSALARFFIRLEKEIYFYVAAVELLQVLEDAGLPLCRPQIAPYKEKQFSATGVYDLSFAFYLIPRKEFSPENIVRNKVAMNDEQGQIFVVTGPNQGGKTTYLRAVGLIQLLAQAGMLVPAESAVLSPVDGIFTHFSRGEKADSDGGRLEEEMARLEQIMQQISGDSLLLMNESFSSTNFREGTIIAQEILGALSIIGTRAVFVTHLYELAKKVARINEETKGRTKLASLVAGIKEPRVSQEEVQVIQRSFIIQPGEPLTTGFVSDIARQYRISYGDLTKKL